MRTLHRDDFNVSHGSLPQQRLALRHALLRHTTARGQNGIRPGAHTVLRPASGCTGGRCAIRKARLRPLYNWRDFRDIGAAHHAHADHQRIEIAIDAAISAKNMTPPNVDLIQKSIRCIMRASSQRVIIHLYAMTVVAVNVAQLLANRFSEGQRQRIALVR